MDSEANNKAVRANIHMDFRVIEVLITNLIQNLISEVIEAVCGVPMAPMVPDFDIAFMLQSSNP